MHQHLILSYIPSTAPAPFVANFIQRDQTLCLLGPRAGCSVVMLSCINSQTHEKAFELSGFFIQIRPPPSCVTTCGHDQTEDLEDAIGDYLILLILSILLIAL